MTLESAAVPDPDVDLVVRHRAGDGRAFDEVYGRYAGMVYGLALRLSGNPAEAEDLTQEVFLRIYRHLSGFRGGLRYCGGHRTRNGLGDCGDFLGSDFHRWRGNGTPPRSIGDAIPGLLSLRKRRGFKRLLLWLGRGPFGRSRGVRRSLHGAWGSVELRHWSRLRLGSRGKLRR